MSRNELVHRLAFSQDNVMMASAEQAVLFFQATERYVFQFRKYLTAKQELGTVEAAVSLSIRAKFAEAGTKATEDTIKSEVTLDSNVNIARHALQEAEVEYEAAKLMNEAYRHRRDSLKVMMEWRGADLRAQQAQEFGDHQLEQIHTNLDKRYPRG